MFDNPIIGRVESVLYYFECNPPFIRNSHPRVGHQRDIKAISACHAVHLLFDRARISIYKDVQQMKSLTITPDPVRVPPNMINDRKKLMDISLISWQIFNLVLC